ncbi:ABC transporter substrate-binding protein [Streptomyces sp. AJS327]|uniref:ABC transporter substrate-binding protein n=1 Tax=Streptomyces sp. AJS327 TaxID=2545265 RepID=UPI0015DEC4C9|nr:ABC transporter substrate-binding protein [Streptomyces sp. AJS327]MBA0049541.1 ABC transporter substrate-binding protein [Streptomyces sp. AJS327]
MARNTRNTWTLPPRGAGPLTKGALYLVLLLALGAGTLVAHDRLTDVACAPGVEERDGECTGVTDGGYTFGELTDVSARIKRENDRVTGDDAPYVTVAMMIPMTSGENAPRRRAATERQIQHEVQGAYLAQRAANRSARPAIRLVLANPGVGSAHWRPVARQLKEMAEDGKHRLRAVVGFDLSERNTGEAIRHMTGKLGIPVVGGPISADSLTTPGFSRVVPSNRDQAAVLTRDRDMRDAFLVEDVRPGDSYVRTLREAFEAKRSAGALESEQYTSTRRGDDDRTLAGDFQNIVQNICQSGSDTVFFAGRPPQLRLLVEKLGDQPCENTGNTFRIITGSGASTVDSYVPKDRTDEWRKALKRVTVEYASVAHPDAWKTSDAPEARSARKELAALRVAASKLKGASLTDSRLMTTYDAARTAITSIRLQSDNGRRTPRLDEVWDGWRRLKNVDKVPGVSGWICLDNTGSAHNKAVHVVRLNPEWEQGQSKITLVRVAWPDGKPSPSTCTAPSR